MKNDFFIFQPKKIKKKDENQIFNHKNDVIYAGDVKI